MPSPERSLVLCAICNKPVALEETKTDSKGAAVHERCYVMEIETATSDSLHKQLEDLRRDNARIRAEFERLIKRSDDLTEKIKRLEKQKGGAGL